MKSYLEGECQNCGSRLHFEGDCPSGWRPPAGGTDQEKSSVLLVGELNPYGVDPRFALFHLPRHASGNRLRLILGLSDVDYYRLPKVNLCGPSNFRISRVTSTRGQVRHLLALPHTSGLNRMWNDPDNVRSARNSARLLAPGIAWGTVEK